MLIQTYEIDTYGPGKDQQLVQVQHAKILLEDIHGEYTDCWKDLRCAEVIWNDYAMQDALSGLYPDNSEVIHTKIREYLIPAEKSSIGYGNIWLLIGPYNYIEDAFNILLDALNVDQLRGDDDFFDYWPNTMDMLWDLANDLDKLPGHEGNLKRSRVKNLANWVYLRVTDNQTDGYAIGLCHEWIRGKGNDGWFTQDLITVDPPH